MGWLSAFAPLCLFKQMLFGLVFVCCWCLVPERGSDLYKPISPSADPKGNQARGRDFLWGVSVLSRPTSAPLSPPLQRQGPRLGGTLLEPGWEVGWETGSLEKAVVYGIKSSKHQREMKVKKRERERRRKRQKDLILTEEGGQAFVRKALMGTQSRDLHLPLTT